MKTQTSSLELHYLLKELSQLENSKVQQIYQVSKKDFLIQFHKPSVGKLLLRITAPSYIYLTETKPEVKEPKGMAMTLRKHLNNSRLRKIRQLGFERILELEFEKEAKFYIYIEMFSKGNLILTNKDLKILQVVEHQKWKDRIVRPGLKYQYPKREYNPLTLSKQDLKQLLEKSNKEIVKTLATDLGLGGIYSEEVLSIADIKKDSKELTDKEITGLNNALKDILNRKLRPQIIADKDIVPFELNHYRDEIKEPAESYSKAFDKILEKAKPKPKSKYEERIKKLNNMIRLQGKAVENLNQQAKESEEKAELIYSNYQLIESILKEINQIRKKHSWKEIKTVLKSHKVIKNINEKEGKITVSI